MTLWYTGYCSECGYDLSIDVRQISGTEVYVRVPPHQCAKETVDVETMPRGSSGKTPGFEPGEVGSSPTGAPICLEPNADEYLVPCKCDRYWFSQTVSKVLHMGGFSGPVKENDPDWPPQEITLKQMLDLIEKQPVNVKRKVKVKKNLYWTGNDCVFGEMRIKGEDDPDLYLWNNCGKRLNEKKRQESPSEAIARSYSKSQRDLAHANKVWNRWKTEADDAS